MAFESKKDFPLSSENFPQRLTIFNQNFTRLLFVCIYTTTDNVQNFIRLSLTLAKLCYMKRASTMNFFTHVSRKKQSQKSQRYERSPRNSAQQNVPTGSKCIWMADSRCASETDPFCIIVPNFLVDRSYRCRNVAMGVRTYRGKWVS